MTFFIVYSFSLRVCVSLGARPEGTLSLFRAECIRIAVMPGNSSNLFLLHVDTLVKFICTDTGSWAHHTESSWMLAKCSCVYSVEFIVVS